MLLGGTVYFILFSCVLAATETGCCSWLRVERHGPSSSSPLVSYRMVIYSLEGLTDQSMHRVQILILNVHVIRLSSNLHQNCLSSLISCHINILVGLGCMILAMILILRLALHGFDLKLIMSELHIKTRYSPWSSPNQLYHFRPERKEVPFLYFPTLFVLSMINHAEGLQLGAQAVGSVGSDPGTQGLDAR
jgi:hypothetical protein